MPVPDLEVVEHLRRRLGLTQAKLSVMAGVSRSSIAKIELAYRERKSGERPAYVPNYEDAKHILETLEHEEAARVRGTEKAGKVAHSPVSTVSPDEDVAAAKKMMKDHNYSQLPVIKDGFCVGRITDEIILEAISRHGSLEKVYRFSVSNIMMEPFPIVTEETPVAAIIPLIRLHRAVLTNLKGKITGIVTAFDVMR